jgi:hypothetical protein
MSTVSALLELDILLRNGVVQRGRAIGKVAENVDVVERSETSIDGVLPVPVFMYHSESDGTVAYAPVPAYVDSRYRSVGDRPVRFAVVHEDRDR